MEKLQIDLGRYAKGAEKGAEKKAPAHFFQSRALAFVEEFKVVEKGLKASVFAWFRRRPDKAEAAYRNMQGKHFDNPGTYFLKLMGIK